MWLEAFKAAGTWRLLHGEHLRLCWHGQRWWGVMDFGSLELSLLSSWGLHTSLHRRALFFCMIHSRFPSACLSRTCKTCSQHSCESSFSHGIRCPVCIPGFCFWNLFNRTCALGMCWKPKSTSHHWLMYIMPGVMSLLSNVSEAFKWMANVSVTATATGSCCCFSSHLSIEKIVVVNNCTDHSCLLCTFICQILLMYICCLATQCPLHIFQMLIFLTPDVFPWR